MYLLREHPEAKYRAEDDAREYEILCKVAELRAKAARKVPEWCPEMRRYLARQEASWGGEWYD